MKKHLALTSILLAVLTLLCGCHPMRVAKAPERPSPTQDAYADPTEEILDTEEPVPTEAATDVPVGTEVPTETATDAPVDTEEPTEAPTDTEAATEAPGTTPTPTPEPGATPAPTPAPTATPTPAPTATPTPAPSSDFSDFKAPSINGYANFSNDTFANAQLTMINFWATWCGPCIGELPEIQQIANAYSGRLQVLTVLTDSVDSSGNVDDNAIAEALRILNEIDVHLPVYRFTGSLKKAFQPYESTNFTALPVTFFVDQNGHLAKTVNGAQSYDKWQKIINGLL